mmetsp:Transcript_96381/g.277550  ORF Transcript_96381/g.277550 Transcript_96381/m.277550 type:complete len:357 (+) Transcript_96381:319-1389(+)
MVWRDRRRWAPPATLRRPVQRPGLLPGLHWPCGEDDKVVRGVAPPPTAAAALRAAARALALPNDFFAPRLRRRSTSSLADGFAMTEDGGTSLEPMAPCIACSLSEYIGQNCCGASPGLDRLAVKKLRAMSPQMPLAHSFAVDGALTGVTSGTFFASASNSSTQRANSSWPWAVRVNASLVLSAVEAPAAVTEAPAAAAAGALPRNMLGASTTSSFELRYPTIRSHKTCHSARKLMALGMRGSSPPEAEATWVGDAMALDAAGGSAATTTAVVVKRRGPGGGCERAAVATTAPAAPECGGRIEAPDAGADATAPATAAGAEAAVTVGALPRNKASAKLEQKLCSVARAKGLGNPASL